MDVLHDYLEHFLKTRIPPGPDERTLSPDGRMLYAYQMNKNEFNELHNLLEKLCKDRSIQALLRERTFQRCFVLYAAEWWKREYSGGAWSWDAIFSSFTNQIWRKGAYSVLSSAVTNALSYWKYGNILSSGKKYFGAIVANGGLPVKFLQAGNKNSSFVRVLSTNLRFATENNVTDFELFQHIRSELKKLPEAIRKQEICELMTELISIIIKLKNDYCLSGTNNPIALLNQRCPNWKDQFPLLIEDQFVEKMLKGFVEIASSKRHIIRGKRPTVERIIEQDNSDLLIFQFNFPEFNVEGGYFVKHFGIENADILPQTFYINNLDENNTTVAIASLIIGSGNKYKIKTFPNRLNVCDPVSLYLFSADNKVHSEALSLAEPLDFSRPLVFIADKNSTLILKSNGSTCLEENECYIAYDERELDLSGFLAPERIIKLPDHTLTLSKCATNFNEKNFFVTLNSRPNNHKYHLQGAMLNYRSFPYQSYKGIPKVIAVDENGAVTDVNPRCLSYFYPHTNVQIRNISNFEGVIEIHVNKDSTEQILTCIVLSSDAAVVLRATGHQEGEIELKNFNYIKAEIVTDNIKWQEKSKSCFSLECTNFVSEVCIKINWSIGGTTSFHLPFPMQGVSFFDENKKCIDKQNISIYHLLGKKIRIFDTNGNRDPKYTIKMELLQNQKKLSMSVSRYIFVPQNTITELKLIDFRTSLVNLLGYSSDLEDRIKISLSESGRELNYIYISRYDTAFQHQNNILSVPNSNLKLYTNDDLQNTIVYAVNLFEESEKIRLEQSVSEGAYTGCWSIESLDVENNTFIVFSDSKSAVSIAPFIVYTQNGIQNLSELYKLIINNSDIQHFLQDQIKQKNYGIWEDIQNLENIFAINDLPTEAINLWPILCENAELLGYYLLYGWTKGDFLRKLKDELCVIPSTIPMKLWINGIKEYLDYCQPRLEVLPIEIQKAVVQRKFAIIAEIFPELEINLYYSLWQMFGQFQNLLMLEDIAPHISKCNNSIQDLKDLIFTKQTFDSYGQSTFICFVQVLQSQNSLLEENWISIPFEALKKRVENKYKNEMQVLQNKLFELNRYYDFISNVVNFPQLCAFYSFYGEIDEDLKVYIKDFMNFNEYYFVEVYKIAMVILLLN